MIVSTRESVAIGYRVTTHAVESITIGHNAIPTVDSRNIMIGHNAIPTVDNRNIMIGHNHPNNSVGQSNENDYFSLINPYRSIPSSGYHQYSYALDIPDLSSEDPVLPERSINLVPYVYDGPSEENCAICISVLSDQVLKTKCNHVFHETCLKNWFQRKQNCPCCRENIQ